MTLPIKPTLEEINDEFGVNTVPSTRSLRNFYNKVFGTAPSGSRQSDFAERGQPIVGTLTSTGQTADEIDLSLTMSSHGLLTCFFVCFYREEGIGSYNTQDLGSSSSGTFTGTLIGLTDDTNYEIYIGVSNAFNDESESDYVLSNTIIVSTDEIDAKPYDLSIDQTDFETGEVAATWTNESDSYDIQIEWRLNGTSDGTNTLTSGTTVDTRIYSDGDEVTFRVRYTSGPDTAYTDFAPSRTVIIMT